VKVTAPSQRGRLRGSIVAAAASLTLAAGLAASVPAQAAPIAAQSPTALQALAPPGLFSWGNDFGGVLGDGRIGTLGPPLGDHPVIITLPESISLAGSIRQVSASGSGGAAVLTDGRLETWGFPVGLGDGGSSIRPSPAVVPGLTGIVQVANAGTHTLALDGAGRVWAWGSNPHGELGNGTTSQVYNSNPTPVPVPGLTGVVQVAAGNNDSFALRSDGTVWAWGANTVGQLGDGTSTDRILPTKVPGVAGVKAIAAGQTATFAIRADGSVVVWGDNAHGLLGIGMAGGFRTNSAPVPGLTGVTQISASGTEVLAVAGSAGTVWAWGDNQGGSAGDGTTTPHYSPAQTGLTGVSQVASNDYVGAAVLANGSVKTWGADGNGVLGIGINDAGSHPNPVLVPTLAGASQISAGGLDVMAIASPAPRIPSVLGDIQSTAAAELQAAGYVLGRVSVVVDLTCEYIGVVKAQSPAAGTIDPPGTVVNVSIGKAGGKCL
jgi:alpha-tubulin suppressor-like RCC1 family protein